MLLRRGRACRAARSRDRGSEAFRVGGVPACVCVCGWVFCGKHQTLELLKRSIHRWQIDVPHEFRAICLEYLNGTHTQRALGKTSLSLWCCFLCCYLRCNINIRPLLYRSKLQTRRQPRDSSLKRRVTNTVPKTALWKMERLKMM